MASTIQVDKIQDTGGNTLVSSDGTGTFTNSIPANLTSATGTLAVANGGTGASSFAAAGLQRPNAKSLVINGDFSVAQRGTSTASVSSGANYVADRFAFGPSTAGTWTISQEALTADEAFEDGFSTAFKADNTTANASLSAGSSLQFTQKIEAQDLQLIKYGSSTAEKMTLGFWVKATKTGTNIVEMYQHDCGRSVSIAYTVSTTNTWEHKIVDIPADTGGTINNDNGAGLEIVWWLAAGTNFTSGSLQTSWGANTATDRAVG